MINIEQLRAVLAKATPRPWYAGRRHISTNDGNGLGATLPGTTLSNHTETDDAAAIVAIMNAAGPLLRELEAAREVISAARAASKFEGDGVTEYLSETLAAYDAATEGGG